MLPSLKFGLSTTRHWNRSFWRTTNLRSLALMDNRILPTLKFGFVERTNPSSFQMWSWVKCFFNFDIWVLGRQIFPTRRCWFGRDEMLSAVKFGFGGILLGNVGVVQETNISNFAICVLRTTTNSFDLCTPWVRTDALPKQFPWFGCQPAPHHKIRGFRMGSIAKINFEPNSFFVNFEPELWCFLGALGVNFPIFQCPQNTFKNRWSFGCVLGAI